MSFEPANPIDILVRALIIMFLVLFGAMSVARPPGSGAGMPGGAMPPGRDEPPPGDVPPPPQASGPFQRSLHIIEKVDVVTLESYPYQLRLTVGGYQPDGCLLPVKVEQRREGNVVYVEIFREVPLSMICTMQLVPYNETIALEGGFESGAYRITINGFEVEVNL